jgi:hypothetical protein
LSILKKKTLGIFSVSKEVQPGLIDERELESETTETTAMIDTSSKREIFYEEPIYEKEIDILAVKYNIFRNSFYDCQNILIKLEFEAS